ncbi:MAG: hypothetical protein DBY37_16005 [Desulfovibrionaceae bacterium]|nr:MAG: hypothetical protein DBY37_16005 [Desulfovibrionaceae bacterium]
MRLLRWKRETCKPEHRIWPADMFKRKTLCAREGNAPGKTARFRFPECSRAGSSLVSERLAHMEPFRFAPCSGKPAQTGAAGGRTSARASRKRPEGGAQRPGRKESSLS